MGIHYKKIKPQKRITGKAKAYIYLVFIKPKVYLITYYNNSLKTIASHNYVNNGRNK